MVLELVANQSGRMAYAGSNPVPSAKIIGEVDPSMERGLVLKTRDHFTMVCGIVTHPLCQN